MKKVTVLFLTMAVLVTALVACGSKKETKEIDINEVYEKVKSELGEDYIPSMEVEEVYLEELFGVKSEDIEKYIAEMPMMSTHVDTFIAIEAKEGKGEDIEAALTTYRTNLIEDGFMYPMNIAKVNSSKVIREGDYVFLLMLGKIDERADVTEEEALKFAEEEVAKVENIINDFLK